MGWRRAVAAAGVAWAATCPSLAAERPVLVLPGPVSELAGAFGFDANTPRARVIVDILRAAFAAPPGQSREADALRTQLDEWLNARAASSVGVPPDASHHVPLLLDEATWARLFERQPRSSSLAAGIVLERRAALLYVGLGALDAPTLAFLSARPRLLAAIHESHAAVFAAFSRSIRVADGRLVAPVHGPGADALCESITGVVPTEPEASILRLLTADQGRIAYLFDTLGRLDPVRQRFATLASIEDPKERRERVRDLARVFARAAPDWRIADRPFSRPAVDPALVLEQLAVDATGRLVGPRPVAFWNAVFDQESSRLDGETDADGDVARSDDIDVVWLLARVADAAPDTRMARLRAVQFVQRLHPSPTSVMLRDVARAAVAVMRFPALALVLERIGVTEAAEYARAGAVASRLSASANRGTDLALVQGTLAVIDRLRFSGAVGATRAASLSASLFTVVPQDAGHPGWLGTWLERELLPALEDSPRAPAASSSDEEARLVAALAGPTKDQAGRSIEWEGTPYVVDPAAAELRRIERVRTRQTSVSLSLALALDRHVRALAGDATSRPAHIEALEALAGADPALPCGEWPPTRMRCDARPALRESLQKLTRRGAERPGGPDRGDLVPLSRIADAALADALVGLAYAVHLGQPGDAVTLAPDIARRHQFASVDQPVPAGVSAAWALPTEVVGGTAWHVAGAVLALDHALAALQLRQPSQDTLPAPSKLARAEILALARSVARMPSSALTDGDRDWTAAAIARGRAEVDRLLADGESASATLRLAGWSQGRVNQLLWSLDTDQVEARRHFTLDDLLRLGLGPSERVDRLAPWGTSESVVAGPLSNLWTSVVADEEVMRAASGTVGGRAVDVTLRVLEFLAAERLPAALAPSLIALVAADLVWEAPLGVAHDGFAVAGHATALGRERLQDYVAELAVNGPLVDAEPGPGGGAP